MLTSFNSEQCISYTLFAIETCKHLGSHNAENLNNA